METGIAGFAAGTGAGGAGWVRACIRAMAAVGFATLLLCAVAVTALAFLYVRAQHDPAINQGDPATWRAFTDLVARRQYDVAPMWPRKAPWWVQFGNLGQYADWQAALSLGPTVMPSVARTLFTILFLAFGYYGAVTQWRTDRRSFAGTAVLFLGGTIGVLIYLNLHPGPSIGWGILPDSHPREARERDYFYVFGFWAWGIWAGLGAVALLQRFRRPVWAGVLVACLPIALNWRAVTRRSEPESRLPLALARAFLESTPRNSVLFVVGDNDSYPLWYAQEVKDVRPDVAIITVPLLPTQWYRQQIAHRFGILDSASVRRYPGKWEAAGRIADAASERGRPIAAAMTVSPRDRFLLRAGSWSPTGLVYVQGGPPVDTVRAREISPGRYARRLLPEYLWERVIGSTLLVAGSVMAWRRGTAVSEQQALCAALSFHNWRTLRHDQGLPHPFARAPSGRAGAAWVLICSHTRFSCASASRTGSTTSENEVCGSATPGIATCSSASSRYWTIIIAWFRSSTACR